MYLVFNIWYKNHVGYTTKNSSFLHNVNALLTTSKGIKVYNKTLIQQNPKVVNLGCWLR